MSWFPIRAPNISEPSKPLDSLLYCVIRIFLQYLVTRSVPCPTRVAALENSVGVSDDDTARIEDECGGDDWLISKIISPEEQQRRMDEKLEEEFDILDEDGETLEKVDSANDANVANVKTVEAGIEKLEIKADTEEVAHSQDADDEYADMEEFEDDDVMEDEAAVATSSANASGENIMKVRTYDLSITYDKYYQTPRVYMLGYASSDSSQPLTGDEMFQDVMSDYANRTVTIDPHPHVAGQYASIHPCQHGAVMKTIVKNLTRASADGEKGKPPSVEMYLFIFLKFISSIIPTVIYDFTMEVTASTEK